MESYASSLLLYVLQVAQHRQSSCEEDAGGVEVEATAPHRARSVDAVVSAPVGRATAIMNRGLGSPRQPNWFGLVPRSRAGCRKRGRSGEAGDTAVIRLRGGDASSSLSSSPSSPLSGVKGDAKGTTAAKEKDDASWGLNLNVFGWGGDSEAEAEAKAESKRKAKQGMEEAEARDAMRKAREERYGVRSMRCGTDGQNARRCPFPNSLHVHRTLCVSISEW